MFYSFWRPQPWRPRALAPCPLATPLPIDAHYHDLADVLCSPADARGMIVVKRWGKQKVSDLGKR